MTTWVRCPYCGRLMLATAKTCGNYCRWEQLVTRRSGAAEADGT